MWLINDEIFCIAPYEKLHIFMAEKLSIFPHQYYQNVLSHFHKKKKLQFICFSLRVEGDKRELPGNRSFFDLSISGKLGRDSREIVCL